MSLKNTEKTLICIVIIILAVSISMFVGSCLVIEDSVLRLHVLANSDDEVDQELKLKVRDRILIEGNDIFAKAQDKNEAEVNIREKIDLLQNAAEDEVAKQGFDYSVNVELCHDYFNTRTYENVTLPAGKYNTVRVSIGSGEGRNWWCVMFPPMCLPAAEGEREIEDVLNDGELKVVESDPEYEIRFKVVEVFEEIQKNINKD